MLQYAFRGNAAQFVGPTVLQRCERFRERRAHAGNDCQWFGVRLWHNNHAPYSCIGQAVPDAFRRSTRPI